MTNSGDANPVAIQWRIDRYLREVDDTLKIHGVAWRDRNSILENIQMQIRELLSQRAGAKPEVHDAEAVIAGLDEPATYAAELPPPPIAQKESASKPDPAVGQALLLIGSFVFLLFFLIGLYYLSVPALSSLSELLNHSNNKLRPRQFFIFPIIVYSIFTVFNLWVALSLRRAAKGKWPK